MSGSPVQVEYAALSHVGHVRQQNEDALLLRGWVAQAPQVDASGLVDVADVPFVCAVLDGMGGYTGGALASRTAAQSLAGTAPSVEVTARLDAASAAVRELGAALPGYDRMGTTVAIVGVDPTGVIVANVGDCRVYRLWEGFFSLVSVDDRVPDPRNPRHSFVSQALGPVQQQPLQPHEVRFAVGGTSTLLICSDGLHDVVTDADVQHILGREDNAEAAAVSLIAAALKGGGPDNVSVAVLCLRQAEDMV